MFKPFIEERFTYKGYPCVVLFMPMAFRTGYVGLPKESKFYQKEYFKDSKEVQRYLSMVKYYLLCINKDRGFRTLDYVKENCRRIVKQIILLEQGENIL